MNKKNTLLITMILLSTFSALTISGEQETKLVPVILKMVPNFAYELGPSMFIEFNRSIMADEQVYTADDDIWFGFDIDIADDTLFSDSGEESYVNQWYFNEPDEFSEYNVTRLQGNFNLYLDNTDLGISNVGQFSGINTTQGIVVTLEEGWHLLTIIAGEVVSDIYHTSFSWQWAKDSLYFYVSEDPIDNPPERRQASNVCDVKSYPTPADQLVNQFEWTWTDIRVATELHDSDVSTLSQTLLRSVDDAYVEVDYNYSTYPLALAEDDGYAVFQSLHHLGPGISFWWVNDGDFSLENEDTFQLRVGNNYVYFAAIGMKPHFRWDFESVTIPTVMVSSKVFTIINDVSGASYGTFSVILGFISLAAIVTVFRKRK
ncbi:MAG: hypothetical protein KGD64_11950 [Candidatus Heimdallarchaeota archaeon]|nr:hypothetical protein [Candidatus Heimdallarchaeota archaeon]